MEVLKIRDLTFTYTKASGITDDEKDVFAEKPALQNVSLSMDDGEFMVLCGRSACGKTTLLRNIKPSIAPFGRREGEVLLWGRSIYPDSSIAGEKEQTERTDAEKIGYVFQDPANQIVTDKVWHELAFGLENLGTDRTVIRSRIAETAGFFGIESWLYKNTADLSGGQKQLLNLASVVSMQPDIIILDEPLAQLDPVSASEFMAVIRRINRENGTGILMTDHRLEDVIPMADRLLIMEDGRITEDGEPEEICRKIAEREDDLFLSMPAAFRTYTDICRIDENAVVDKAPIDVRSGRVWIESMFREHDPHGPRVYEMTGEKGTEKGDVLLKCKDVWFRYEKNSEDILKDFSLELRRGDLCAVMGGNGTGKTTALKVMKELVRPYRGKVSSEGKVSLLMQDPRDMFAEETVEKNLMRVAVAHAENKEEAADRVNEILAFMEIEDIREKHPYDISGGQQQKAALAMVLITDPDVILLDEPTKGIDAFYKKKLARTLRELAGNGKAVLAVTHDIEFCGEYMDECAMLFDGKITSSGSVREVLSANRFYTTAAARMSGRLFKGTVSAEDIKQAYIAAKKKEAGQETAPETGRQIGKDE
ncbi:MAG: ATP-binding cassette domain-containing protein [Firmicutes bacterium]|nr:ATP-binding cassette domain-containing protein [Bacillota bacterium]